MDDIGTVFFDKETVIRAINDDAKESVMQLLESGLIERLVEEGVFPQTTISTRNIEGYSLVLEHEKIQPLTYPFEWSPEMLRHAGFCVLRVNAIANEFGYELKDSHVYNLVFKYNQPMCVDFGSLVKKNPHYTWLAYGRFKCAYLYALELYKMGGTDVFNNLFLVSGKAIDEHEYWKIKYPVLRLFKNNTLAKLSKGLNFYSNSHSIPPHLIQNKIKNERFAKLLNNFVEARVFKFFKYRQERLEKKLNKIKWTNETTWGTYHQRVGLYTQEGEIKLSDRLNRILELIEGLEAKTVLELAGNQGVFSREIAKLSTVKNVICSDYDEDAIDKLFLNLEKGESITPVRLDFMRSPIASRGALSSERLKSDVVVALAVTHHLILGQKYSLDYIISSMVKYSKGYLIVEFMPMGLYSKRSNLNPGVPDWYSEDWFVDTLTKFGKILNREQLEENRIVFLVKIDVDD